MNESDIGKVFLCAVPWDWTWVGRVVGFVGDRLVLSQAGYFTLTGATFDILCTKGFNEKTKFHFCGDDIRIPNAGIIMPWHADWPQKRRG